MYLCYRFVPLSIIFLEAILGLEFLVVDALFAPIQVIWEIETDLENMEREGSFEALANIVWHS